MNVQDIKNLRNIDAFDGEFAVYITTEYKCGIINRQGEIIVPADKYDGAVSMGRGIFMLQMYNGKLNDVYYDANKREIIEEDALWYNQIHGGVFVFPDGEKRGLRKGKEVLIPAIYDHLFPWCNNFWAKKDGKWGTLDINGKVVLPFEYDEIVTCSFHKSYEPQYGVIKNGKAAIINPEGQSITKGDYEYIETFNGGGFAIMKQNGKIGIIDRQEHVLCMTDFSEIEQKEEGRYSRVFWCQSDRFTFYKDGLFGIMDINGKVVVPAKYEKIGWNYQDGKISVKENGLSGIIDYNGTTIIPCEYASAGWYLRLNAYKIRTADKKEGYLDSKGEVLIPAIYDYVDAETFYGLREIAVKKDGRCYFINEKQEEVKVF